MHTDTGAENKKIELRSYYRKTQTNWCR